MPEEVAADELQTASSSKYHRNHAPYTARIKKMMQADEDVGKVAKASPILICECVGREESASSESFAGPLAPAWRLPVRSPASECISSLEQPRRWTNSYMLCWMARQRSRKNAEPRR